MSGTTATALPRPSLEKFSDLTLIVPTLNEADTVPVLLQTLGQNYPGATVIVADDDSHDGTRDVARAFRGPLSIRVLHRNGGSVKGLTASVVDAIKMVETPHFVVMDADLQHPPEAVLEVYRHASNGADLAVGRRVNYTPFTAPRRAISRGARALTRGYLRSKGKPAVDDPMSGFFGGKTAFARGVLSAHESGFEKPGFKVLVDFLRFAPSGTKVEEVPYEFGKRVAGASKMRISHMGSLLRQLGLPGKAAAYALLSLTSPTFWKFATVGMSGVAINQGTLFLGHGVLGLPLLAASLVAIQSAILWNFFWNDRWSFRGVGRGIPWAHRLVRFNLHCAFGAAVNAGLLAALVHAGGLFYLTANMVGIAAAMAWNWGLSHAWTWREQVDEAK